MSQIGRDSRGRHLRDAWARRGAVLSGRVDTEEATAAMVTSCTETWTRSGEQSEPIADPMAEADSEADCIV